MAKKDAYPREFRERAVALYRAGGRSKQDLARELGISPTSLHNWVQQAAIDAGEQSGVTTDDRAELARLRRENRRLELEVEILKRAAAYFAKENVLPKGLSD
ncbi:transposase [Protaetiibacter larvae]|uniref:transposase n=1 Tax=Protaetiibacter larvae TaxID=2592654 RepID=UPI003CCC5504